MENLIAFVKPKSTLSAMYEVAVLLQLSLLTHRAPELLKNLTSNFKQDMSAYDYTKNKSCLTNVNVRYD